VAGVALVVRNVAARGFGLPGAAAPLLLLRWVAVRSHSVRSAGLTNPTQCTMTPAPSTAASIPSPFTSHPSRARGDSGRVAVSAQHGYVKARLLSRARIGEDAVDADAREKEGGSEG